MAVTQGDADVAGAALILAEPTLVEPRNSGPQLDGEGRDGALHG